MKEQLTKQLRRDEGEVLHAYSDHLGFLTIGIGRLIDSRKGGGITQEEAAYLLSNDIDRKTAEVEAKLPWSKNLDEARKGVLIAMCFQMGLEGLLGFKNTLKMIMEGKYSEAAQGMLNSKWAQQTPARAQRLAKQMESGTWQ